MIQNERYVSFINSLDTENPAYLNELEEYAKKTEVPIIRKQMQSLIRVLLTLGQPKQILEVGTAIGFSALFMSEYAPLKNMKKESPLPEKIFVSQEKNIGSHYWRGMQLPYCPL